MLDQDRYWDCLEQATQATTTGRVEEALAWLDEALRANPRGAEAHSRRGEIFWERGRCDESLEEFHLAVEADPDFIDGHLNRIEILIEEFAELEEALDLSDDLLARKLDRGSEAEVYYLKAKALFYLEDLPAALFLLRRAIQTNGEVPVYRSFEGQILFEMGSFEAARRSLERARAFEPDSPHGLYHLALVLEHVGEHQQADRLYGQACRSAPDQYPEPVRMPMEDFEVAADEAVRSLPSDIAEYVANCPILIEELPGRSTIEQENVSPQILGLFVGVPTTEPGASPTWGTQPKESPDRIYLYKRNLEKVAQNRSELIEQIQITVKHEIGHFLGLDEDELDRLGLG
jgi:predicted Zn-dependent protease with MMP-like domain